MPRFEDLAAEGQALVEVGGAVVGVDVATQAELAAVDAAKAPLASPALTGTPTVPTAPAGTNTTQAASTAFVKGAVDTATSPSSVWYGFESFAASGGSPIVAGVGANSWEAWRAWLVDAAAEERLFVGLDPNLLSGWSTFDVDIWWTNAGAGAGNVVFTSYRNILGAGDTITTFTQVTTAGIAAPAQNVIKVSPLLTGIAVPATSKRMGMQFGRLGANAADTLANDAGIIGLNLRKAS